MSRAPFGVSIRVPSGRQLKITLTVPSLMAALAMPAIFVQPQKSMDERAKDESRSKRMGGFYCW
jgi:hypothetical protein